VHFVLHGAMLRVAVLGKNGCGREREEGRDHGQRSDACFVHGFFLSDPMRVSDAVAADGGELVRSRGDDLFARLDAIF